MAIDGEFLDLGAHKQPGGGKTIVAWAHEGDFDPASLKSNTFPMEWPPRSGKTAEFPEVDKAGWYDLVSVCESDERAKANHCGFGR